MSYGLQVINNAGQILVDTNAYCLHFMGAAGYAGTAGTSHDYRITLGVGPPLVFIRPAADTYFALKRVSNLGGGQWQVIVASMNTAENGVAPVGVYVFAPLPDSVPAAAYGMQCFNANGQCVFDSTRNPMAVKRLISAASTGDYINGNIIESFSVPALSLPAVHVRAPGFRETYAPISGGQSIYRVFGGMAYFQNSTTLSRGTPLQLSQSIEDVNLSQQQTYWDSETILMVDLANVL